MPEDYITKADLLEELRNHEYREEAQLKSIFLRLGALEKDRSSTDKIIEYLGKEIAELKKEVTKFSENFQKNLVEGARTRIVVSLFSGIGTAVLTAVSVNFFLQK